MRMKLAEDGVRHPVQVIEGNHQLMPGTCPWWDAVTAAQGGVRRPRLPGPPAMAPHDSCAWPLVGLIRAGSRKPSRLFEAGLRLPPRWWGIVQR